MQHVLHSCEDYSLTLLILYLASFLHLLHYQLTLPLVLSWLSHLPGGTLLTLSLGKDILALHLLTMYVNLTMFILLYLPLRLSSAWPARVGGTIGYGITILSLQDFHTAYIAFMFSQFQLPWCLLTLCHIMYLYSPFLSFWEPAVTSFTCELALVHQWSPWLLIIYLD